MRIFVLVSALLAFSISYFDSGLIGVIKLSSTVTLMLMVVVAVFAMIESNHGIEISDDYRDFDVDFSGDSGSDAGDSGGGGDGGCD